MAREADFLQKTIEHVKGGDFKSATVEITGIADEDNALYFSIFGCLEKLFNSSEIDAAKIPDSIKQIISIYDKNKDSPSYMEEELDDLVSQFGTVQLEGTDKQEVGDLSSWTDSQLEDRLKRLKKEQQNLLSSGKAPDPKAGEKLNKLLEEQSKRLGYKGKKITVKDDTDVGHGAGKRPEGADDWFVLPSQEELENNVKTHVICGSPIIKVLRDRYQREYKIKQISDVKLGKMENLSGDEEYEIKRELNRQRDFVSNYSDPSLVIDQDMCAYAIASEFLTDKYPKPELIRINDNISHHLFKSGSLKDSINPKTAKHSFSMEGNVVGHFAVCLNRKEPQSGRFISDAYDVIEFQDGQPSLYFCSAKGVSALSSGMIKDIKMMIKNVNVTLNIADPAVAGKMASKEELDKFILEQKEKDSISVPEEAEASEPDGDESNPNVSEISEADKEEQAGTAKEPESDKATNEEPQSSSDEGKAEQSEPDEDESKISELGQEGPKESKHKQAKKKGKKKSSKAKPKNGLDKDEEKLVLKRRAEAIKKSMKEEEQNPKKKTTKEKKGKK
jgi:hypothetical protein